MIIDNSTESVNENQINDINPDHQAEHDSNMPSHPPKKPKSIYYIKLDKKNPFEKLIDDSIHICDDLITSNVHFFLTIRITESQICQSYSKK
jgi:hypothetical protein